MHRDSKQPHFRKGDLNYETRERLSWVSHSFAAFVVQALPPPPTSRVLAAGTRGHAVRDTERVRGIEAEIDRLAADLWGLTEEELGEMRLSKAQSVQRRE